MEEIKVTDIAPNITEKFVKSLQESIQKLDSFCKEYETTDSLFVLEDLKKVFNSELIYFSTLYARTKSYKGPNHTYFEKEVKKIKAMVLEMLVEEKYKITMAESLIYKHEVYLAYMKVVQKMIEFFTKIEELYNRYEYTLTCIVQSVSVQSKEFSNNQKTQ